MTELTQKWQAARTLLTTERLPLTHLRTALLLAALAGTTVLVMYLGAHEAGRRVVREEAAQMRPQLNLYAGALDEVSQGLSPGLASTHFEIHEIKFVAEIRVGVSQVFSNTHQSLVKCESDLDADYREVQGIRQCQRDASLPIPDHALEHKTRDEEAKSSHADH